MTDEQLCEFYENHKHFPVQVCRMWRFHPHYQDIVSAARCELIKVARAYTGENIDECAPLAYVSAKFAALRYLNLRSHTVRRPLSECLDNYRGARMSSIEANFSGNDDDPFTLADLLPSDDLSAAEICAAADDVRFHINAINALIKKRGKQSNRRKMVIR